MLGPMRLLETEAGIGIGAMPQTVSERVCTLDLKE